LGDFEGNGAWAGARALRDRTPWAISKQTEKYHSLGDFEGIESVSGCEGVERHHSLGDFEDIDAGPDVTALRDISRWAISKALARVWM
jgi:hypothetical protein